MRISDWSSDVCSSDLRPALPARPPARPADLDAVAVAEHEHVVERDLVAGLVLAEQLDAERLALHHAVLLTAGDQNCRSAERRVGKECVSTCRSRGAQSH